MARFASITELIPQAHPSPAIVEASEAPILWDIELPKDIEAERIRVNMSRLSLIHEVGAMSASFVESYETAADRTDEELAVGAYLDRFNCTADMKGSFGTTNLNATYGRAAIVHQVNEHVLAEEAENRIEQGFDPAVAWAGLYDKALRSSLKEGAHRHLMGRNKNLPKSFIGIAYGSTAACIAVAAGGVSGALPPETVIPTIAYYDFLQTCIGLGTKKSRTQGGETLERRWSVVPFARQPDRYLGVRALSAMPGLVQAAA